MAEFIDMKTIKHIKGIIKATLDIHDEICKNEDLESMYGTEKFRTWCQTVTVSLPRRLGHTTAALELLYEHPNALYMTNEQLVVVMRKQHPDLKGYMLSPLSLEGDRGINHPLRSIGALAGIDFILVDTVVLYKYQVDKMFDLFNPKLIVFLGDSKIREDNITHM